MESKMAKKSEGKLRECVVNPNEECPLILNDYTAGTTVMLRAIDVIAQVMSTKHGYFGNSDCDSCKSINAQDAIDIIKALRDNGIELVPIKGVFAGI
jgi:hypothetical protein